MFDNIKEVIQSIQNNDIPSLEFHGGKTHPLIVVVLPFVAVGAVIIFTTFTILAIIIDCCNLFVRKKC